MARVHHANGRVVIAAKTNVSVCALSDEGGRPRLRLERSLSVAVPAGCSIAVDDGDDDAAPSDAISAESLVDASGSRARNKAKASKSAAHVIDEQVLGSAFSNDRSLFAVVTSTKVCWVFDARDDWKLHRSTFTIPKAPTSVTFDADARHVLVADRAGSVRRYSHDDSRLSTNVDSIGERCEFEGEPLTGHVSIVLGARVSRCGRFLLSADRDEKLRVSRYPQSFVIHRFCLGHTSYISSLEVVPPHFAFTAGGDGTVRLWNILDGTTVAVCDDFDKKHIRCLRISQSPHSKASVTMAVVMETSGCVKVVSYDFERRAFEVLHEAVASDSVVDVAFVDDDSLIGITRSSVVMARLGAASCSFEELDGLDSSIVESLKAARDGIPFLGKKLGFNNVEEYLQRKRERACKRKKVDAAARVACC